MPIPPKKKSIDRKSARTIVYDTLRDWIVDGTLRPGEKLIDTKISDYFSVSRTPVREAFQMLSDQNLVEIIPSKGTRVTLIDTEDLRNVYKSLSCIHSGAVKFSFDKIDNDVIKQLKSINKEMSQANDKRNFEKLREKDNEFHNVFLKLSANPYFITYNDQLLVYARRVENLNFNLLVPSSKSVEEHYRIIEAIENNDRLAAMQAMEENWLRFIEKDLEDYNR